MKLYFSPGACSLSPHIVLLEAGLAHTIEKVDLGSKKTASGQDFRAINGKGYVPALETDSGLVLTEGPVIAQYLADLAPEKNLAPPHGSIERYQMMSWLNFVATEIHKNYSPLFDPTGSADVKAAAFKNLARRYAHLDSALEEREHLTDQFSLADIYLYVVTNWAGHVKFDLAPFVNVQAFQQRIGARPAVQQALRAEGLLP